MGGDRLAFVAAGFGIKHALYAIDGEVKAMGTQAGGTPLSVGVEVPDTLDRTTHFVLGLEDMAVATSGDYRHFVEVKGTRLSHTIDPRRGAPLVNAPASVMRLGKNLYASRRNGDGTHGHGAIGRSHICIEKRDKCLVLDA